MTRSLLIVLGMAFGFEAFSQGSLQWQESVKNANMETLIKNKYRIDLQSHNKQTFGILATTFGLPLLTTGVIMANQTEIGTLETGTVMALTGGAILSTLGIAALIGANKKKKQSGYIEGEIFRRSGIKGSITSNGIKLSF